MSILNHLGACASKAPQDINSSPILHGWPFYLWSTQGITFKERHKTFPPPSFYETYLSSLDSNTIKKNRQPQNLRGSKFFNLLFTNKNGVNGEYVRHGHTGNPRVCAVVTIWRRVLYLQNKNDPETPCSPISKNVPSGIPLKAQISPTLLDRFPKI